jgi:hypothetical protein
VNARLTAFVCACAASIFGLGAVADAASPSAVVTVTSTTLTFTASDMATSALTSSPLTASASITFTTTAGTGGGTVTVTSASLPSVPTGSTLSQQDFTLTCKRVSGSAGFTAAAAAQLNGATTCGTLGAGYTSATTTFSIQLTLNDTALASTPFNAATYLGTFTVTATAH